MSRRIAVIGTGYVGLVTAVGLSDFGHYVVGVDIDNGKIEKLSKGQIPIYEPGLEEYFRRNVEAGRLSFTTHVANSIKNSEVIFIAVGTPSKKDGDVDLSYVFNAVNTIGKNLNGYKVIVIKSTVPVGTNRDVARRLKEITGNNNFDVVSNPEFLREGKAIHDFFHPDRIVIGTNSEKAKEIMKEIYRPLYLIETPFVFCNPETAELIKYASNAFLATKITFINQIANLAEEVGADVHVVAKAMGMDGRISPKFLHPGPGFGGSCFPKDTRGLVKIGEKYGVDISLVREVIRANEMQKERVIQKLKRHLGKLDGKKISILGVSFKAETDDVRESPAIYVCERLIQENAILRVTDPRALNNFKSIFGDKILYFENVYEAVSGTDAIVILVEWNEYRGLDLEMLREKMKGNIIIDFRNVLDVETVERFGFIYDGIGRRNLVEKHN